MSHPNPHHDRDNEYAQDSKGPVASKKKSVAKKMGGRDATKSKHWEQFVNVYRSQNNSTSGLDSSRVRSLSDKELKRSIDSYNSRK